MIPEELKNYLKENLKISIDFGEESYRDTIEVSLYLEDDLISYSDMFIDDLEEFINKQDE